jgi:hypothetical protein
VKYALPIYGSSSIRREDLSEDELREIYESYSAIFKLPGVVEGTQLQPIETATSVRIDEGETILSDRPMVDGETALIGSFVFEGENLDEAIAVAAQIPAARMGGGVEVRPIAV